MKTISISEIVFDRNLLSSSFVFELMVRIFLEIDRVNFITFMIVESENDFSLTVLLHHLIIHFVYGFKNIFITEDSEANIDKQFDSIHGRSQS